MATERPVNLSEKRISNLRARRTKLLGEIAEIDMEIQRLEIHAPVGEIHHCEGCPHCKPDFVSRPFVNKLNTPPYEHLLQ